MATNTSSNLHFINISARAYQYIRQFSVKTIEDALVELITNSIDAYKKTQYTQRKIDIEITNPGTLVVRDYALGLDASQLDDCFLNVGNFTASDTSRGFFSRGAKDISAIGNVYFTGIKNNSIAQAFLNTDAYGEITLQDTPITPEYRSEFKIPDPLNGLTTELDLLPTYQNIDVANLAKSIAKIATLRDILVDPNSLITLYELNTNGNILSQYNLSYTYPNATNILDIQFNVPGYTQYTARFTINQTATPIPQPSAETKLEFGFLIKDNTSVYEVDTLDGRFRWNPYINYLYGYLYCDGIHALLLDYDANGPSTANPFPVIDPSRITGVNNSHPFIIALFSIPLVRLDYILRQLNVSKSTQSISIDELNDLMDELHDFGEQMIKNNSISVQWHNNYDSSLAQAISDDRMKYVNYEKIYQQSGNFTTEDVTLQNKILSEIILDQQQNNTYPNYDNIYVYDSQTEKIIPLQNLNLSEFENNPQQALSLLTTDASNALKVTPYIWQLTPDDQLAQLYIFSKGDFSYNNQQTNMKLQNKNFTITFINDLNLKDRYLINSLQGVNIQINLNNPIVKKYLAPDLTTNTDNTTTNNTTTDNTTTDNTTNINTSISTFSSVRALIFLKELLTDAIANIIMGSDVLNKKITLDTSDPYNSARFLVDHKSKLIPQIEPYLDGIFQKYIDAATNSKFDVISSIISQISQSIATNMSISSDLYNLHDQLLTTVQTSLNK